MNRSHNRDNKLSYIYETILRYIFCMKLVSNCFSLEDNNQQAPIIKASDITTIFTNNLIIP